MNTPSISDLRKAVQIKEQIEQLQRKLASLLGSRATAAQTVLTASKAPGKKRTMSAAGRARIIAAQKARWAKIKGTAGSKANAPKKSKKSGMSAAAKAKLSALMKQRWAARKKAGKSKLG